MWIYFYFLPDFMFTAIINRSITLFLECLSLNCHRFDLRVGKFDWLRLDIRRGIRDGIGSWDMLSPYGCSWNVLELRLLSFSIVGQVSINIEFKLTRFLVNDFWKHKFDTMLIYLDWKWSDYNVYIINDHFDGSINILFCYNPSFRFWDIYSRKLVIRSKYETAFLLKGSKGVVFSKWRVLCWNK